MRRTRLTPARAGMTLVELLIVMIIIAILAALSLSAVFTVRESQMKSFTESLISKLASALDGQWKAAVDQIREEPVPPWAVAMGGGDPNRAKAVYLKARLKQEFPVTFYQAIYPYAAYLPGTANPYPTFPPTVPPLPRPSDLPPKPPYRQAIPQPWYPDPSPNLLAPVPAPDVVIGATPISGRLPAAQADGFESAALLYLTLTQGRRGQAGFNPDEHIEPTAIQTRSIPPVLAPPNSPQIKFKIFVDSWGNPVRLWTFPYRNMELNTDTSYRNAFVQNQQSADPQDPERTFATWLAQPSLSFRTFVHPILSTPPGPVRLLIPVIGSTGRDSKWGADYFTMDPGTPPSTDGSDNIYSYRLRRTGARGD